MKYVLIIFEEEQYWIEINDMGYALRQINISSDKNVKISCLEDCLGEGCIEEDELAGEIKIISQSEFEAKWAKVTLDRRKLWENQKQQYPIGKTVKCRVKYLYPQGWIVETGQVQGVCRSALEAKHNQWIEGEVEGYDEKNMWLKIIIVRN